MKRPRSKLGITCSFCGKHHEVGRRVIAGPGVYICSECVKLCNEILSSPSPSVGDACLTSRPRTRRGSGWLKHLLSGRYKVIHTPCYGR